VARIRTIHNLIPSRKLAKTRKIVKSDNAVVHPMPLHVKMKGIARTPNEKKNEHPCTDAHAQSRTIKLEHPNHIVKVSSNRIQDETGMRASAATLISSSSNNCSARDLVCHHCDQRPQPPTSRRLADARQRECRLCRKKALRGWRLGTCTWRELDP
jgi:hypothetical protein